MINMICIVFSLLYCIVRMVSTGLLLNVVSIRVRCSLWWPENALNYAFTLFPHKGVDTPLLYRLELGKHGGQWYNGSRTKEEMLKTCKRTAQTGTLSSGGPLYKKNLNSLIQMFLLNPVPFNVCLTEGKVYKVLQVVLQKTVSSYVDAIAHY